MSLRSPEKLESLTASLLSDQQKARSNSQEQHQMNPAERKTQAQMERVSKREYGGNSGLLERNREISSQKALASKETKKTKVARGQIELGTPLEQPDR